MFFLLSIIKFKVKGKKYIVIFELKDGKIKKVYFGVVGYFDYIINKDLVKKWFYIVWYLGEDWFDFMKVGILSCYILWEDMSLKFVIKKYKKCFKL